MLFFPLPSAIIIRLDTNLPTISTAIAALSGLSEAQRSKALAIADRLPSEAQRDALLSQLTTVHDKLTNNKSAYEKYVGNLEMRIGRAERAIVKIDRQQVEQREKKRDVKKAKKALGKPADHSSH